MIDEQNLQTTVFDHDHRQESSSDKQAKSSALQRTPEIATIMTLEEIDEPELILGNADNKPEDKRNYIPDTPEHSHIIRYAWTEQSDQSMDSSTNSNRSGIHESPLRLPASSDVSTTSGSRPALTLQLPSWNEFGVCVTTNGRLHYFFKFNTITFFK